MYTEVREVSSPRGSLSVVPSVCHGHRESRSTGSGPRSGVRLELLYLQTLQLGKATRGPVLDLDPRPSECGEREVGLHSGRLVGRLT